MKNALLQHQDYCRCIYRSIVIAAEGQVTEPEYFSKLNSMKDRAVFSIVPNLGNGSDPSKVLDRMKKYLRDNPLSAKDEAWIVIDEDKWSQTAPKALAEIDRWVEKDTRHHRAMSKRKFEDWLKLHIDNDPAAKKQYERNISGDDKHIPDGFITKERVKHATKKAKRFHQTKETVGNVFEIIECASPRKLDNLHKCKKRVF